MGAWVSNPPKPILATLCLAHWHSDPMLLRLWTQSSEKPYRFFKHIISGWGFKNITNHLKVLVQCGSIVPSSWGPIYRHGHCKEFPLNYMTTPCQQVFPFFSCYSGLNLHRCSTLLWKRNIFSIWIEWNLHNYIRVGAGLWAQSFRATPANVFIFHRSPRDLKNCELLRFGVRLKLILRTCSHVKVLMQQFNK